MRRIGFGWKCLLAKCSLFIILFSVSAWGADETCRVDLSCTTSGDGSTWVCGPTGPKKTIAECLSVANDGDGGTDADTIIMRPGMYTGFANRLTLGDIDYNNLTVCGTTATGLACDPAARDLVVIDTGEYHSNYASAAIAFRVKYLTLRTTSAHVPAWTTEAVVSAEYERVRFRQTNGSMQTAVIARAQAGHYRHCLFEHTGLTAPLVGSSFFSAGGTETNLYWPMFGETGGAFPNYAVWSTTTGSTTNIYHAVMWNARIAQVRQAAAGTINIYNSIIGSTSYGYPIGDDHLSAVINLFTSIVIPYKEGSLRTGTGSVNLDGWSASHYAGDPLFSNYPNAPGYIVLSIDDSSLSEAFVVGWGSLLKSKGMTGTYYLDMQVGTTGSHELKVRNALATGSIEIGVHGYSHSRLTATTVGTLLAAGGTNPQYLVDQTNRRFAVRTDEGIRDYSFIWSPGDPTETMGWVLSNMRAATGNHWNIEYAFQVSPGTPVSSLADTGGWLAIGEMGLDIADADCSGGTCSGYWRNEIYYPKERATAYFGSAGLDCIDARTGAAFEAKTYSTPYNPTNASVQQALRTSGYLSSRSVEAVTGPHRINLFSSTHFADGYFFESTGEGTANTCRAMAVYVAMTGDSLFPMGHGSKPLTGDNSWETCLDAIKPLVEAGWVEVLAFDEWAEKIKNRPEYTYHYTGPNAGWAIRTFGLVDNWQLAATSPLINAGSEVPGLHDQQTLALDYAGQPIVDIPDIGAYEYAGAAQFAMEVSIAAGNGTITSSATIVDYGGSDTFTIIPAAGFRLARLTDNGMDVTGFAVWDPGRGIYSYIIANVTSNHYVQAVFGPAQFTMTETIAEGNGTITSSSATVNYGGSDVFTITPAAGYRLTRLHDNGTDVTGSAVWDPGLGAYTYTITNITSDHSLQASFDNDPPPQAYGVPAMTLPGYLLAVFTLVALAALLSARSRVRRAAEEK